MLELVSVWNAEISHVLASHTLSLFSKCFPHLCKRNAVDIMSIRLNCPWVHLNRQKVQRGPEALPFSSQASNLTSSRYTGKMLDGWSLISAFKLIQFASFDCTCYFSSPVNMRHYAFEGFVRNQLLRCYALPCAENMAATFPVFRAEY